MSIGENIKKLRKQHGMTQKELGIALGLNVNNADVRVAQYESGVRMPKEKLLSSIAHIFEVDPAALTAPDASAYIQLMNTLNELGGLCKRAMQEIESIRAYSRPPEKNRRKPER